MKNLEYYMNICNEIAKMSKCLSRKIGVIIITPDGTILGSGYNGPSRGVPHCDSPARLEWLTQQLHETHFGRVNKYLCDHGYGKECPRRILKYKSGEGLHICPAGHAERNAIVNSAREGVRIKGCWMIMNCPVPCQECCKSIINSGIVRIICKSGPDYDTGSRWMLEKAGVEILQIGDI